jgi:hypothetical protein
MFEPFTGGNIIERGGDSIPIYLRDLPGTHRR